MCLALPGSSALSARSVPARSSRVTRWAESARPRSVSLFHLAARRGRCRLGRAVGRRRFGDRGFAGRSLVRRIRLLRMASRFSSSTYYSTFRLGPENDLRPTYGDAVSSVNRAPVRAGQPASRAARRPRPAGPPTPRRRGGRRALHDRQPQPRAGHRARLVGAVEAVEHARQVLVGDPRPGVGHLQQRSTTRPAAASAPAPSRPAGSTSPRCRAGSAPPVPARSASPMQRPRHEVDLEADVAGPAPGPLERPLDDLGELDAARARPAARRRGPARPGRRPAWTARRSGPAGRRGSRRGRPRAAVGAPGRLAGGEQLQVGAHRGQRGAQLVPGVGDEPALLFLRRRERAEHLVEAVR